MKIYIATRFRNKELAKSIANELITNGHEVTSLWIWGEQGSTKGEIALADLLGVEVADALLLLAKDCEGVPGGMWVEMGYALGKGKSVYYLGTKHNIFCEDTVVHTISNISELPLTE